MGRRREGSEKGREVTPEAMRMRIAESQGIEVLLPRGIMGRKKGWGDGDWNMLPDYPNSLDACAEMRKCVPEGKRFEYAMTLAEICCKSGDTGWGEADATAPQHCETFCRVMDLYVEDKEGE